MIRPGSTRTRPESTRVLTRHRGTWAHAFWLQRTSRQQVGAEMGEFGH